MPADDHRHCKECGKVCPPDRQVCSARCQEARDARLRSRRQLTWFFYAAIAILLVLLLLGYARI